MPSVALKLYTRVLEKKLRKEVEVKLEEGQSAFRKEQQTQDMIWQIIMDKCPSRYREVYFVFMKLQSKFDTVQRYTIWAALQLSLIHILCKKLFDSV